MLVLPGRDPEGVGLSWLDSGRLAELEPSPSLTPSWWRVQFLPHQAGHEFPLLTRFGMLQAF